MSHMSHDLKPLSEIPASDIGTPALAGIGAGKGNGQGRAHGHGHGSGVMQRSQTLTGGALPTERERERRHYDPCREPKLLHFM